MGSEKIWVKIYWLRDWQLNWSRLKLRRISDWCTNWYLDWLSTNVFTVISIFSSWQTFFVISFLRKNVSDSQKYPYYSIDIIFVFSYFILHKKFISYLCAVHGQFFTIVRKILRNPMFFCRHGPAIVNSSKIFPQAFNIWLIRIRILMKVEKNAIIIFFLLYIILSKF